jgi:hypothetical protein
MISGAGSKTGSGSGSGSGAGSGGGISRTSASSSLPPGLPPSGSYWEKSMTANGLKLGAGSAMLKVTITSADNFDTNKSS